MEIGVKGKFCNLTVGNGINGMELNLNLVQCLTLAMKHNELKNVIESGKEQIPVQMINDLIPFLKLFESFYPESKNIWDNNIHYKR